MIRWIVGPKYDFCFFSGSVFVSMAFYFLYLSLKSSGLASDSSLILSLFLIFSSLIDVPHLLHTFSRTHIDSIEFRRHRTIHREILVLALLISAVASFYVQDLSLYVQFVEAYGIWHVMKQNWGFIRIYQKINYERDQLSMTMDKILFYSTTAVYCTMAISREWGEKLRLVPLTVFYLYFFFQVRLWKRDKKVNVPKLLFVCMVFPSTAIIHLYLDVPPLLAVVLNSAYHGIQYYGWNMHFQRKRLSYTSIAIRKWNLWCVLAGTLITLAFNFNRMFEVVFTTFVLFHYFTDGIIWRFNKWPELSTLLEKSNGLKLPQKPAESYGQ